MLRKVSPTILHKRSVSNAPPVLQQHGRRLLSSDSCINYTHHNYHNITHVNNNNNCPYISYLPHLKQGRPYIFHNPQRFYSSASNNDDHKHDNEESNNIRNTDKNTRYETINKKETNEVNEDKTKKDEEEVEEEEEEEEFREETNEERRRRIWKYPDLHLKTERQRDHYNAEHMQTRVINTASSLIPFRKQGDGTANVWEARLKSWLSVDYVGVKGLLLLFLLVLAALLSQVPADLFEETTASLQARIDELKEEREEGKADADTMKIGQGHEPDIWRQLDYIMKSDAVSKYQEPVWLLKDKIHDISPPDDSKYTQAPESLVPPRSAEYNPETPTLVLIFDSRYGVLSNPRVTEDRGVQILRPGGREFLNNITDHFEIIIASYMNTPDAKALADELFPDIDIQTQVIPRRFCLRAGLSWVDIMNSKHVKKLLAGRDPERTIVLQPLGWANGRHREHEARGNVISVPAWNIHDPDDYAIEDLLYLLEHAVEKTKDSGSIKKELQKYGRTNLTEMVHNWKNTDGKEWLDRRRAYLQLRKSVGFWDKMDEMARKEEMWINDMWDEIMQVEGERKRVEDTIVAQLNEELLQRW